MPVRKVTRDEIVKEALTLFRSSGYHKTSMADIGNACGLLKGSIYHYFASKEALMTTVLGFLREYYREKVFVYAFDPKRDALERLRVLGEKSLEIFMRGDGACLMANIAMETTDAVPEFSKPIRGFFDDWMEALTHIYREKYSRDAAVIFARESICAIEGAALMMRIYHDKTYLEKAHEMILHKFVHAGKDALINWK